MDIRVISASAGSGKTYRLSEELYKAISEGEASPDAVVLTTFTKKAASDLQQRVRQYLLKKSQEADDSDRTLSPDALVDAAQRLTASRIGTVHSVCHGVIRDFAFELGISPELDILETPQGELDPYLVSAISEVISEAERDRLGELGAFLGGLSLEKTVQDILKLARTNDIPAERLADSAERSKASLLALLGEPAKSGKRLDRELARALERLVTDERAASVAKTNKPKISSAEQDLAALQQGRPVAWSRWAALTKLTLPNTLEDLRDPVIAAAAKHDRHPALRAQLAEAIDLTFDIAARALDQYQQYKKELGLVDFSDLESETLRLLAIPEVQDRLRGQLDLVMVDEFQDTNPIQLAIFLRLAALAKRSVWVGDQKQSIFRFRGSDPALMDAVIGFVEKRAATAVLPYSWRSRPKLVALTSDVFVPAFASQSIPEKRVRLKPAPKEYPDGLGEPMERWVLDPDEGQKNALDALAAGVKELLADTSVRVRDPDTGVVRPVEPRDVAVLPFSRITDVPAIAASLRRIGVEAISENHGLDQTAELTLALAALNAWAAPDDTLAAATLARFLEHPTDTTGFLMRAITPPDTGAFSDSPTVAAIRQLALDEPQLGLLDAYDRLIQLTSLRDLCRRWGNSGQRFANLEAIRGQVVTYLAESKRDNIATTPAGLIAHLDANATAEAAPPDANAVTVVNWHRCKGLEWPVVILTLNSRRKKLSDIFDVSIATTRDTIDPEAPLEGRWIRYWFSPFGSHQGGVPFLDRLPKDRAAIENLDQARREELRLLYVVWTRARDRLILAGPRKSLISGTVAELLNPDDGPQVATEIAPDDELFTWAQDPVPLRIRELSPQPPSARATRADKGYRPGKPRLHPPARLRPSELTAETAPTRYQTIGEPERLGDRLRVRGKPSWTNLGSAMHAYLAAERRAMSAAQRTALAQRLLDGWGVAEAISTADVITAATRLRAWIDKRWPGATWHREWHLTAIDDQGSVLSGQADLVLETKAGYIVIDHKTFDGSDVQIANKSRSFFSQLGAYAVTLDLSSNSQVVSTYLHLPTAGVMVPMSVSQ